MASGIAAAPRGEEGTGGTIFTRPFLLTTTAIVSFGFAWSVYFLVPKYLTTALHASPTVVGRLTSLSGIASMLAVPFVGTLIDRSGRRRWMTAGSLLLVVAALAFYFADGIGPLLYVGQALQGVAFVLVFNAASTLVADFAPAGRLAQAIGLFGAAHLSMNAVAPATAESVAKSAGWDAVFVMSGVSALVAAAISRLVPEPPLVASQGSAQAGLRAALSTPLVRVYAASTAMAVSFASLLILHQPMAIAAGVTEVRSFFIGFTVTAIAVRVLLGRLTDRVGSRRIAIVAMSVYAGVPALMIVLGPTQLFLVGACLGLCHGALYPAVSALGLERCAPSSRGMVLSLLNGAFNGGTAVASLGLGRLADVAGYPAAFGVASLLTLVGVFMLLGLGPEDAVA